MVADVWYWALLLLGGASGVLFCLGLRGFK